MTSYSQPGHVSLIMPEYIDEILNEPPNSLMKGTSTTPAATHLFNINSEATNCPLLMWSSITILLLNCCIFPNEHVLTCFLLFLSSPHVFHHQMRMISKSWGIVFNTSMILNIYSLCRHQVCTLQWWVDASFAVHPNCCCHNWKGYCLLNVIKAKAEYS